jgi:serine/threonine-protein kinase
MHPVSGRYELKELVAAGGMADVYEGHDRLLDRPVAVKRLRGSVSDPAARERFEREARLLAGFSHPNSVRVYDALEDDEGPYIVMELVDGETLRSYLRRRGRLSIAEAVAIGDQLLGALGAAHAQGIVHRDVKPANVLVTPEGNVKLADFGIATMSDATELTMHGQVVGTPKYLSPEQAMGEKATPASDLYAVGVLLFEMAAGRPPFDAETSAATLAAHTRAPVPSLRDAQPDVPEWYADVVERALAKNPADRFPDAASMRAALLGGEASALTEAMTQPVEAVPTRTLTMAAAPVPVGEPAAVPRERPRWLIPVVIAIAALLISVGAWAVTRDSGTSGPPHPTTPATTTPATTPPTTAPPAAVVPAPRGNANEDKAPPGQQKKGEDSQG